MDNLYIYIKDVQDYMLFELLVGFYNCRISMKDDLYFVVEGTPEDIKAFGEYWIHRNEMD